MPVTASFAATCGYGNLTVSCHPALVRRSVEVLLEAHTALGDTLSDIMTKPHAEKLFVRYVDGIAPEIGIWLGALE